MERDQAVWVLAAAMRRGCYTAGLDLWCPVQRVSVCTDTVRRCTRHNMPVRTSTMRTRTMRLSLKEAQPEPVR